MKKVSILLATYNGEKYISQQIQSLLLNLTLLVDISFKIFISDDDSTDSTRDIIKKYMNKYDFIHLIDHSNKGSANSNFQFLIKNVVTDADYIFFCDQDDFWLPNKIKIFIDEFELQESNKNLPILLYSDLTIVNENLLPIYISMFSCNKLKKKPSFYNLLSENVVTGCACAINKTLFDLLQKCDFQYSIMHDRYISIIAFSLGKIKMIDYSTVLYRQHQNNVIGVNKKNLKSILLGYSSILEQYESSKIAIINTRKQAISILSEKELEIPINYRVILSDYVNSFNGSIFARFIMFQKGIRKKSLMKNIVWGIIYIFFGKRLLNIK